MVWPIWATWLIVGVVAVAAIIVITYLVNRRRSKNGNNNNNEDAESSTSQASGADSDLPSYTTAMQYSLKPSPTSPTGPKVTLGPPQDGMRPPSYDDVVKMDQGLFAVPILVLPSTPATTLVPPSADTAAGTKTTS